MTAAEVSQVDPVLVRKLLDVAFYLMLTCGGAIITAVGFSFKVTWAVSEFKTEIKKEKEAQLLLNETNRKQINGFGGRMRKLDQGDCLQRVSLYFILSRFLNVERDYHDRELKYGFYVDAREFMTGDGRFRRTPDPKHWGYDVDNLSRDNHAMLLLAFAVFDFKVTLESSWRRIISRYGFYQNIKPGTGHPDSYTKTPDVITPNNLTMYLRGTDQWYFYPVLLTLDLLLPIEILLAKLDGHDYFNMLGVNIFYAATKYPTPWSILAFHILKYSDFLKQVREYYSEDKDQWGTPRNGLVPLGELYAQAFNYLAKSKWYL